MVDGLSEERDEKDIRIDNHPDEKWMRIKKNIKKNPWMVSTIVLAVIGVILFILVFNGGLGGISGESAGEKIVEYLNARTGGGVEYVSYEDLGNIYQITVNYQGQQVPVFASKDGEYFIQGAVPITLGLGDSSNNQQPQDVPKSDKPVVELFVMTHCPYGTQAEKGMLPVFETLGDRIDGNIRFVHYFMHEGPGEEPDETPVQLCIREEQSTKYSNYLKCFLEDGKSDRCLTKVNIDRTKLNKCLEEKSEEYYAGDSELSKGYGVRGSPTLVVNGQVISSARSPSAYLKTICSAFNEAPEECSVELSSASPSSGFGYETGGTDTQAQC